jgi:hypothetical protein
MPALAADPTIRRQVMAAGRELLEDDAAAPVARIATAAGVSRAVVDDVVAAVLEGLVP